MKKSIIMPPRLFMRFFRSFCDRKMRDYIEGDLMEVYDRRRNVNGKRSADLMFIIDVLLLFRPGIIRPPGKINTENMFIMYRSYFKIGWRNLLKNQLFSIINVGGMAISIASFLLIALFLYDELQFDKHINYHSRKYRVYTEGMEEDGSLRKRSMIPPMIAATAAAQFPEVESYTRFLNINFPVLFEAGDKKLTEDRGGYADPSVFDMLSMPLVEGDARTALLEPNTVAISHTLKRKYFGDEPALGEVIEINNVSNKVTAVFDDFPRHSHLRLNFLLAMEGFARSRPDRMQRWTWDQFHTYVKLKDGTAVAPLEKKMADMLIENTPEEEEKYLPKLMPITDIHLHAYDHLWDIAVRGNIQTFYILIATAIFIVVVAILNFVNLSTARAINRVREVGVRKVMGAFRSNLITQFISESFIIAVLALVVGACLATVVLPPMNAFTEKDIPLDTFLRPMVIACLLGLALVIGVTAGAYPALYVSGHQPATILSGKSSGQSGKTLFRKGLVVFQFVLSFFLIIGATIVSDQYTFMRSAKMGFDKDNLLIIQLRGEMQENLDATKRAYLNHKGIVSGSMGYGLPGEAFAGDGIIDKATNENVGISMLTVDHDYVETLGLEIIAGRDFSTQYPADEKHSFVISERGAQALGYTKPEEALGHPVAWERWDAPDSLKEGRIIGVVRDLQLNSMRETINPVILHVYPFAYNTLTMKVAPEGLPSTIAHLEKTWKSFNTEWPFEYRFLDANFDRMYKSEERLATLFKWFTAFTIFVSCLGLFGLVVYSTAQKFREISIRKILGAGEGGLIVQLSKSYLVLIAIAFVIAVPVSYFAASEWLQKFAFRVTIRPSIFLESASVIVLVALITVGAQAYRASRANPVNALRQQD